jgi:tripartite-type tricarboxylate transporter receptor subunit TctC
LFVPHTVPPELAPRLNEAVKTARRDPDFRSRIEASGSTPGQPVSLSEADRFLTEHTDRYRRLAQAVKLEPQ